MVASAMVEERVQEVSAAAGWATPRAAAAAATAKAVARAREATERGVAVEGDMVQQRASVIAAAMAAMAMAAAEMVVSAMVVATGSVGFFPESGGVFSHTRESENGS